MSVFIALVAGLLAGEALGAPSATSFFRNATTTKSAISETGTEFLQPPNAAEPQAASCATTFMGNDGIQSLHWTVVELCRSGSPTHSIYYNPYPPVIGLQTAIEPNNIIQIDSCSSSWETDSVEYFATAPITTTTVGTEVSVLYEQNWDFVATSPCCMTCSLYGGTVQVYFWPTPAPSPHVSALVNTDNFTFISPSIYVAFESLYASDLCGDVGKGIPQTTIAFDETALSTCMDIAWDTSAYYPFSVNLLQAQVFTEAHFGDQSDCEDITSTWYNSPISGVDVVDPTLTKGTAIPYTFNPCSPAVSVPSQLFGLNPLWKSCLQGVSAFFDPPYTLQPGNGLKPFTTPAANVPADPSPKAGDPAPGAAPNPGSAKPTDPPSVPNDPPSQQPPPANNDPSPQPEPPTDPAQFIVTLGDSIITANSASVFRIDSRALSPGGPPILISGTGYSVRNNGVVVTSTPDPQSVSSSSTTTVEVMVGSQTLVAGGPYIMHSGTLLSLDPSGSSVVVGGSTTMALSWFITSHSPTTAASLVDLVVGSQTLVAGGPAITVSDMVLSLETDGSSVIVGGTTVAVGAFLSAQTAVTTSSMGLGGIIASVGGFATPTPTPTSTSTSTSTQTSSISTKPTSVQIMNNPTNRISTHLTTSITTHSTSVVVNTVPSGTINCGSGLLICQVEDPTRLEAPWHGVSAAFPQCYDPTTYKCVENFLCPITAPKIKGEYACGPS